MKKILILALCVVFTTPLFSFNDAMTIESPCTDYCTGYADGVEAGTKKKETLDEWNAIYNNCLDTSSQCQQ